MSAPRGRHTAPSIGDRIAAALPRREQSFEDAPCAGRWWCTDLPTELRLSPRRVVLEHFAHSLTLCASCPLLDACRERVQPAASYYDGVCAGAVYRNGRVIGGITAQGRAA